MTMTFPLAVVEANGEDQSKGDSIMTTTQKMTTTSRHTRVGQEGEVSEVAAVAEEEEGLITGRGQ